MTRLATLALASLVLLAGAPSAHALAGWTWPLRGEVITPYRNGSDPYAAGQHRGIDIAGRVGAPVVAAAPGSVRFAGTVGSSGLTVTVRTPDGRFDTSYLHLSTIAVAEGQRLRAGERLGAVGTSGRRSAAQPHLHFSVRDAGSRHAYHDPLRFLPPATGPRPEPRTPRGAPAPSGAPVRAAPERSPDPHRAPRGRRIRVPSGRRVPSPAPRPLPVPSLRGVRAPGAAPRDVGVPLPGLEAARRGTAAGAGDPVRRPGLGPARSRHPAPGARARPDPEPGRDGPDLGWALACLGLLLAAACVGTRGGDRGKGRGDPARPRARLGGLLRPLTRRG
jgi:peptidase M23-like protein